MRFLFGISIFIVVFTVVSALYLQSFNKRIVEQFKDHALIVSEDIWALNEVKARSYLQLAMTRDNFKSLTIIGDDQSIFLSLKSPPLKGVDRFFESLNVIWTQSLTTPIHYGERRIATLMGERYIRAAYQLFNILIFLLFISLAVIIVGVLFFNRKELEKLVMERTKNLKESERRFHDLVNLLPEMVWETDLSGEITFANRKTYAMMTLKQNGESNQQKLWHTSIVEDEKDLAKQYFDQVIKGNGSELKEFFAISPKGRKYPLLIRSAPILRDNTIAGARFVAIDITDRYNLEEQLKKAERMKAIGIMAGGVAHDLNNILSGIVTYPELLLLDLPADSPMRPQIEAIHRSGIAAADVVSDLLTAARGAAAARKNLDILSIIAEYLNSPEHSQLLTNYPHVTIQAHLQHDVLTVHCSPTHIRKCIMNLIINGAESIEKQGEVVINAHDEILSKEKSNKLKLKEGKYAVITISDTGKGIAEADLDHIFEPFYTKKVMGKSGTGLGLTVVWNTVKEHEGTVQVESTPSGTRFQLYLPMTEIPTSPEEDEVESYIQGNGEHVLIVDDEKQQQDIAASILNLLHYKVSTASSGDDAIAFLKHNKADLLILDMIMEPGMNGRQTYQQALKLHPGQKAIIVSGYSKNEEVKKALQLGAAQFLAKPYGMAELGNAVYTALKKGPELIN